MTVEELERKVSAFHSAVYANFADFMDAAKYRRERDKLILELLLKIAQCMHDMHTKENS